MDIKSLLIRIGVDTSALEKGLDNAQKKLESHRKTFTAIGASMTIVGGALTAFFTKSIEESARSEAQTTKLKTALSNVAGAAKNGAEMLVQYASSLQASTGYSNDEIKSAMAMLATFQLNERQIAAITPRLLDMAAATEKATGQQADLQSIAIALGKGFTGQAGSLARYGVVLSDQSKKTGDFNAILHDLDLNFKGTAAAMGQTLPGQLRILKTSFADLMKVIGAQLVPILIPLVEKVGVIVKSVMAWFESHKKLASTLIPIIAGLGTLSTILGPMVMVLPQISGGVMALAKAFIFLATNPIVLVIAGIGAATYVIYKLVAAMREAAGTEGVFNEANKVLMTEMMEAGQIVGMTAQEFMNLEKKYSGNALAMKAAILAGKEGKNLQEQLIFVLKKHGEAVDEQGVAYDKASKDLEEFLKHLGDLSRQSETTTDKIKTARKSLTDEIQKLTLSEYAYEKFAAEATFKERQDQINKEIPAGKERDALLLLARRAYEAQVKSIDDKALTDKISFLKQIADEEDAQTVERIRALKDFEAKKKTFTDSIKKLTMSEWSLVRENIKEEHEVRVKEIKDSEKLSSDQKATLLAQEDKYYAALIAKGKKTAKQIFQDWKNEMVDKIARAISSLVGNIDNLFSQAFTNESIRIDNEEKMKTEAVNTEYETKKSALDSTTANAQAAAEAEYAAKVEAIERNVKDEKKREKMLTDLEMAKNAKLEALKKESDAAMSKLEQEKADAEKKIAEDLESEKSRLRRKAAIEEKAVALISAIVNTAAAVVKALPNIPLAIAVGIMGAVQVALIAKQPIPLAEGGIINKETLAYLHPGEAVIPLKDLKPAFAMAGGAVTIRQSNYFYGNIQNAGDVDKISQRLAERVKQAISKGRRY